MIKVSATNSCSSTSGITTISASVNNYPQSVNAGADVSICSGGSQALSASATTGTTTLFNTDCNYGSGWTTNDVNRWYISNSSYAGGTAYEFRFNYYLSVSGINANLAYSNAINTTGYTSLSMSFKHMVDWYSGTFNLYVETSPDNVTWTSRWTIAPTADVAASTVNVDLSALNGTSFYIRFRFSGNTSKINDWFIDDISITGTPSLSYSWINTTTGLSSTSVNNPTASPTTTTTYTVQATAGGCSRTDDILVTVNQPSVAPTSLSSSVTNSCSGSNVTLTQSGGSLGTGAVWQWYTDANFTTPVGSTLSSSNASLVVSPTTTTTYYLRAINGTSPCTASIPSATPSSVSVTVTIGGLVSGTHNTTALTVCDGYNPVALTITAPTTGVSPYTYQWKINGSNATTGTGATTLTYDDTALAAGTYTYTCVTTDACGNSVTSSPKNITVVADPSTTNPSSITQCLGGSSSLSVTGSGGTPSLSYQWYSNTTNSNTGGTIISGETNTTYTPSSSVSGTTYYYCVVSATGSACNNYSSSATSVVINGPSNTSINSTIGQTLGNGDYVWNGSSSVNWTTVGNWYKFNGTSFDIATIDPTSASNVYIVPSSTTQCISSSNSPTLDANDVVTKLFISTGADLNTSSNTISVSGDVTNNGTVSGTGTIKLNGTGTQTISGTGTMIFPNMEVSKTSGSVTLSTPLKISNTLTMTSGDINNSSNIFEVGTSTSNLGSINWTSGKITGPLKRWFGTSTNSTQDSGIFPVGSSTYDRYAQINFTSAPSTGGYIIGDYLPGLPSTNYIGLPLNASGQTVTNYEDEGYWELTPYSTSNVAYGALNTATYTVTLRGNVLSTVSDYTVCRIIKTPGPSHASWQACGTHNGSTGSNNDFVITSTGVTGFSWFNIGSSSVNALPITMLDFSANCADNGVLLTWETASENNTSHFNLEKSRDGVIWDTIATIEAAGNSTQLITYNFTDKNAINGVNYYRLNQYDINGVYEQFGPISINCLLTSDGYFNVYPNPSDNSFNIVLNNDRLIGDCSMNITDEMGRTIFQKDVIVKSGINLFNLEKLEIKPGVYYVSINNTNFTSGVIKQIIR
jgi:hypothetical protein